MTEQKIVLPEQGIYFGKIKNWYLGQSQSLSPFIEFVVAVTHKETEDGQKIELSKSFSVGVPKYLTRGAAQYTMKDLAYLGYPDKSAARLDREHPDAFDFSDIEVTLRCKHDEYKGVVKDRWELVRRSRPVTGKDKQAMIARLSTIFEQEMPQILGEMSPESEDKSFDGGLAEFEEEIRF